MPVFLPEQRHDRGSIALSLCEMVKCALQGHSVYTLTETFNIGLGGKSKTRFLAFYTHAEFI